mgnify:CR=1 FL=1
MKWIKQYESFSIDDLEDYLQEFFDEFHILKWVKPRPLGTVPLRMFYYEIKNGISIDGIPKDEIGIVEKRLREIKPQIEKRLGYTIDIEKLNGYRDGRIKIERHFRVIQNGSHSIGFYENVETDISGWKVLPGSQIEILEDCLQEIFDKFHIIEKYGLDGKDHTYTEELCYNIKAEYSKMNKKWSHYIRIENIPPYFEKGYIHAMYIIIGEINKIKNTIEKRIGSRIMIEGDFIDEEEIDIKII